MVLSEEATKIYVWFLSVQSLMRKINNVEMFWNYNVSYVTSNNTVALCTFPGFLWDALTLLDDLLRKLFAFIITSDQTSVRLPLVEIDKFVGH